MKRLLTVIILLSLMMIGCQKHSPIVYSVNKSDELIQYLKVIFQIENTEYSEFISLSEKVSSKHKGKTVFEKGFGAPVYYHEKRSKGAVEYLNIAKELAERI